MPYLVDKMQLPHILTISQLGYARCCALLDHARRFREHQVYPHLEGKAVALAFFEPSTRTRISFELAAQKLGCHVVTFTISGSSIEKGESFLDTLRTLEAMGFECIVIRHRQSGAPEFAANQLSMVSIVNAGDGMHEHPTQALLDALTLNDALGSLEGTRIAIIGDIAHSRVFRSNVTLLQMLGAQVGVCAPPLLCPKHMPWKIEYIPTSQDALAWADAVIVLRLQRERMQSGLIPSLGDYRKRYAVRLPDVERSRVWILHPGPVNPDVEIDAQLVTHPRSLILQQVRNGVFIRMAVLASVFGHGC